MLKDRIIFILQETGEKFFFVNRISIDVFVDDF